jgi:trimeric autotransporter adhesin
MAATETPEPFDAKSDRHLANYDERASLAPFKVLERDRHMKTITKFTCPALAVLALVCFAALSTAQAVTPPPDGGYTGWNTAEGSDALFKLTTGGFNTAIGAHALYGNATGPSNTAVGAWSLAANSSGYQNVAIGQGTLRYNTTGPGNTATGFQALYYNFADYNTANGNQALFSNTSGFRNTANGNQALFSNTTGEGNTATGYQALYNNHGDNGPLYNGDYNTANGHQALFRNTSGYFNTGIGHYALHDNTTGHHQTAIGNDAMARAGGNGNTATGYAALVDSYGDNNTANGLQALSSNRSGSSNTAVGYYAGGNGHTGVTTGSNNTLVGYSAGANVTTANNVICFGSNVAGANVSNTTWIDGIYGVTTLSGTTAPVIVSADGQLGTIASSERFKKDIAPMKKTSEAILSLRPVTFHYKTDVEGIPQFGLIAEEVAKVNPALVLPDKEGKPYTVRYDAVNAMLLNEFLKEHLKNEEQEATIARQQKQIEALTAGLQKVSAQLELNKPAPQTVLNDY